MRGLTARFFCVNLEAGQRWPAFLLNYMNHTTPIPNLKLSPWYYAVLAAKAVMQQKITEMEQAGIVSPAFYIARLAELEDLEQFLKMSWDEWMDSLAPGQTAVEESK